MPRSQHLPKHRRTEPGRYPPALQLIINRTLAALAPPPTLTVSEWADRERRLSPEASAEPGAWETSRAEYLRGIMDSLSDPIITRVVVAKGSQVGYTECVNNVLGFFVDQDPAPILVIQPTVEMAEAWSKDRLSPMLRDTPCLAGKVKSPLTRDTGNTLRQKVFTGGRLAIVGANSPAGLASRPVRIVIADEVDRFPLSAGSEGDPLALASKRQGTFWNRKTLLGSTPTIMETSVIWREWLASDQRHYLVPCFDCGHEQRLAWSNVRWDKTETGQHLPHTAHYICEGCGSVWTDIERHDAVARGRWVATNHDVIGIAGFHITGLLSPWISMADVVREFLAARKNRELLQVWSNTVLGEPFKSEQETVEGASLLRRGEAYGSQSIPDEVQLLTAGIDVQGDRLEVQIIGFGPFEEMYAVRYEVLPGDPTQEYVWQLLDAVLKDIYRTDTGRELRVRVSCVDTGGHHQHAVLTYCRTRRGLNVLPIKGVSGPKPIWPPRSSRTKDNSQIFMCGVDTAKDVIYSRLRLEKPGPGYVHFPVGGAFDPEYFAQLTSEAVQTRYKEGRPYRIWVLPNGKHNEALDCAVYCLAARHATRIQAIVPRPTTPPTPPIELDDENPPEGGPVIFDQARPQADPDQLHKIYSTSRQPQQAGIRPPGWIHNGRVRGNWFNPNG
jgi:phage terminase large subunit GpA-like protein